MNYTNIEQSKKLATVLPLKSADLWWTEIYKGKITEDHQRVTAEKPSYNLSLVKLSENNYSIDTINDIPCWSAEALLNILPKHISTEDGKDYSLVIEKTENDIDYFIAYHDVDMLRYEYVIEETGELISVLFKIVEWLLTNKFI